MNIYKKTCATLLASACGLSLAAATYTWVPGSTDWTSPSSYKDEGGKSPVGVLPGPDDTVIFDGTETLSINDTSFPYVASIGILSPLTANVTFQFDLAGYCCLTSRIRNVNSPSSMSGHIVKKGTGTLQFGNVVMDGVNNNDYRLSVIDIQEGALIAPTNIPQYRHFSGGTVTVDENAYFYTPAPGNFRYNRIFGSGVITNLLGRSGAAQFQPQGGPSTFAGRLDGTFSYFASGRVDLTGTNSTFKNGFTVFGLNAARTAGLTGLMKLGERDGASSLGKNTTIQLGSGNDGSGGILYLGKGECTTKNVSLAAATGQPMLIDAGAYGGVHFAGNISMLYEKMMPLVLTGSNTVDACVISNSIAKKGSCTVCPIKQGTGKWRFACAENAMSGSIAVENGTLQFDSLAAKGTPCALGTAMDLYKPVFGAKDDANLVDYAYLLGSATTVGTLEYLGTATGEGWGRPVRLTGKGGRLTTNGGTVKFDDVAAETSEDSVLYLDGEGGVENTVSDIRDVVGRGKVSVVKEGGGIWHLDGEQTFSGNLDVKAGTLVVHNRSNEPFSWFRLLITETAVSCERYQDKIKHVETAVQLRNVDLKDANGRLQLLNATLNTNWRDLQPGEVSCYDGKGIYRAGNNAAQSIQAVFHGDSSPDWATISAAGQPKLGQTNTWFTILMRMTNGAPEIASFDMKISWGTNNEYVDRTPTAYELQGSCNGHDWTTVLRDDAIDLPTGNGAWISNKTATYGGIPLERRAVHDAVSVLENVGEISVAPGATLRIEGASVPVSKLKLDASGNGTIENLVLASSGTLTVVGAVRGKTTTLPVTFRNCGDLGGLSNWKVRYGDEEMKSYKVNVGPNGEVSVVPPGMLLIVR